MRDLAFDIMARDKTQAAFNSAQRNASDFGMGMTRVSGQIAAATSETNRLAAATDRAAAAGRRLMSANDNWRRRNLMMQGFDVGQMLALGQNPMTTLLQQGPQIAQMYAGQGGVKAALSDTLGMAKNLVKGIGPIGVALASAAAMGGIALAGMQQEINASSDVWVSYGDVAKASVQVIADGIYQFVKPAVDAMAPWFASAWDLMLTGAKATGNAFIAGWATTFDAITILWGDFPAIMGDVAFQAGNAFLHGVNIMLDAALQAVKGFYLTVINPIAGISKAMGYDTLSKWTGGNIFDDFKANLSMGKNPWEGAAGAAGSAIMGSARTNFSTDYFGNAYDDFLEAVKPKAIENAMARAELAANKAGAAMGKAANDNIDPWEKLREVTEAQSQALNQAGRDAGNILKGLVDGTLSWKDALTQAASAALKLLNQMNIEAGGKGLFGGGFLQGLIGSFFGFAKGGAFSGGNVIPFARGGVIDRPTVFPFAKGVGMMGEAGPEAIMPLRRSADGKLGVAAAGLGGRGEASSMHVTFGLASDGALNIMPEVRSVAQQESSAVGRKVASSVPAMVDARNDERQYRRLRARSAI